MCAIDIVKNRIRLKICESSRQRTVERNRLRKNRWEMFNGVEKSIRKSSVNVSFINKRNVDNGVFNLKIYVQYIIFAIYINNYEISPPSLEINIYFA